MRLTSILAHQSLDVENEITPVTEHMLQQAIDDVVSDPESFEEITLRKGLKNDDIV